MAKRKQQPERINGSFSAIPHAVLDSLAFTGASDRAKSLLFALMRQLNGQNNGHLQLTRNWLKQQGWVSCGMNSKARDELIERGLIIQTKCGGLNISEPSLSASLFAVTWLHISNFVGLDISPDGYHPGQWNLCKLPPTKRRNPPIRKCSKPPDHRNSTDPTIGTGEQISVPTTGTINGNFDEFAVPTTGNNVVNTNTYLNPRKMITGGDYQ